MHGPDPRAAWIRVVRRGGHLVAVDVDGEHGWDEVAELNIATGQFWQPTYGLNRAPELFRPGLGLLGTAHKATLARSARAAPVAGSVGKTTRTAKTHPWTRHRSRERASRP